MNSVQVDMRAVFCATCGIVFAVPYGWFVLKQREEEAVYCPNGHEVFFTKPDAQPPDGQRAEESARDIEARRERIRKIHEQEQAEARAADGKTTPIPAPTPTPWHLGPWHRRRLCCPCGCEGKSYKYLTGLRKHLQDTHSMTLEDANAAAERVRQETIERNRREAA